MDILFGIILTIIGIITPYLINHYIRQKKSWNSVLKDVEKIYNDLKKNNYEPEILISFPKGGLIVADLLGHLYNNKIDIISIHTERFFYDKRLTVSIRSEYINFEKIHNKRILIIDDVIAGGETMAEIKKLLIAEKIPSQNIKTAVLGITSPTIFEPDFHSFKYNLNKTFYFPWGKLTL